MMKLSIVIPAYNEAENIGPCLAELKQVVGDEQAIPYEIIIVDDNSGDATAEIVRQAMHDNPAIRLVQRTPPGGFGRAIRSGLDAVTGDVVVICMADLSDDPQDVVAYYRKICEGYDCVFGSRFMKGSKVEQYPPLKLFVNRIVNRCVQLMFWTRYNDMTNAFKAYRTSVIRACGPYQACHFNITLELSLNALTRRYNIAQIPIRWYGRQWGSSNLKLREMGRRYLSTLLMMFFQRMLIADDLLAERLAHGEVIASGKSPTVDTDSLLTRLDALEQMVESLRMDRLLQQVEVAPDRPIVSTTEQAHVGEPDHVIDAIPATARR